MASRLEQFIKDADHIPSIPTQITNLLQTISSPTSNTAEIVRMIAPDATLSARLLRLANSSFYYRMAPVTRISDALTRLGFKTTRSLIVAVWTQSMKVFMHGKEDMELLSVMLNHGTACAVISRALIERINRPMAEDAFLAALLHDMGRLTFTCQYGTQYERDVLCVAEQQQKDTCSVEEEILGFDHCLLGAHLMDAWHLPVIFRDIARDHHAQTIDPTTSPMLAAVAIADEWATSFGHNVALDSTHQSREDLLPFFKIPDLPAFKDECSEKIEAMMELLEE